ncbi:MAG: adenylate/guanylate cyclase domain-containing protein [Candidatus Limnocylindria bacterium]
MTHASDGRGALTLRFDDPRIEAEYERDLAGADRRRLRVASIAAIAIWAVAALVGPPLLSVDQMPIAIAAISVTGMNLLSLALLHSRPTTLRTQRRLLAVINMTSVVAILVVITTSGIPSSVAAPSVILNFMFTLPQRIAFPAATVVGIFHVVAYGVFAAWVREGPDVVFNAFLVASAVAIGLLAIRLLEDAERSSYAQARLVADLHRRVDRLLHQYLSPGVAQVLIDDPARADLGGEAVDVTVLFADLQDFTPFSERKSPADVVAMLNAAFGPAVPAIFAHGGTIIQFAGDAVVAVFNAPVRQHDHALRAGRAALALQASTAGLPVDAPRFRVGLNTGPALVGNIGSAELRNFVAIGDTTNLAARLQSFATPGTVVIADRTRSALGHAAQVRDLGEPPLKGKTTVGRIYELVALEA